MTKIDTLAEIGCAGLQNQIAIPCEFGTALMGGRFYGDEAQGIDWQPFGRIIMGDCEFGDYTLVSGVYAKRMMKEGSGTIRTKYYTPRNPRLIPQQANRGKFAGAVLVWQNLTLSQKKVYNDKAVGQHMSGYNRFIKIYMSS